MDQAQNNDLKGFKYARWIALTGLFMGINIIMPGFDIHLGLVRNHHVYGLLNVKFRIVARLDASNKSLSFKLLQGFDNLH